MAGEQNDVTELEGQVTDLEAQVADLQKKLKAAAGDEGAQAELLKSVTEMTTALEETTSALEKASAEKADLEKVLKLTDAQRAHYNTLEKAEDKKAYLDMKEEDKEKEVKKRAENDETVTIEGQVIRKSAVGDATFSIMKAQADRIAKNETAIADEVKKRETVTFQKRADDEFGMVPGTTEERGAMLAAISKMDEPLQKSFLAVFTQSQKLAKAGFDKIGKGGDKDPKDPNPSLKKAKVDFEAKAAEIKKRDSLSSAAAFSKARKEFPELYKAYQGEEAGDQDQK